MKVFSLLGLLFVLPMDLHSEERSPAVKEIAARTQKKLGDRSLYFRGLRIYESMCVDCHGRTGRGNGPWAESMPNKPRNFRSGHFKFRTTPYGKLPSDDDLKRTIRAGISGTAMPTFAKMNERDLDGVVTFVQSLSRRWKEEENYAVPLAVPEPPASLNDSEKIKKEISKGELLFKNSCVSCHGPGGKGDGPSSKGLIDLWEQPIAPADLSGAHYKSGDSREDLFRSISMGLDGTPMVGFLGALKTEEIWSLVAYVQSLKKK